MNKILFKVLAKLGIISLTIYIMMYIFKDILKNRREN
jgi:hypothetical protein